MEAVTRSDRKELIICILQHIRNLMRTSVVQPNLWSLRRMYR